MTTPAVAIQGLVKAYGGRVAVRGLSLEAATASITAVVGPNGAGKTTTLECCEGYRRADQGSVRVLGLDPLAQHSLLQPRVGVLLQSGGVFVGATAAELLRHAAALYATPLTPATLVERLDLGAVLGTPYRRLSGGEQRRVGLALALVGRPEVLFLDEPTAGLDPHGKHAVWRLLEEVRSDGVSVVVTTHAMDEVERLADQVFVIDHGEVLASGSPADLLGRSPSSTLSFRAPSLDLAALQARLPAGLRIEATGAGRYRVSGAFDPQLLTSVTTACTEQQVAMDDLVVSRRSLEDVYLELTGSGSTA